MTIYEEATEAMKKACVEIDRLREVNAELLSACKGALACLVSGDLTPDMTLVRLRRAINKAEDVHPR
jgi:hypothetical protein